MNLTATKEGAREASRMVIRAKAHLENLPGNAAQKAAIHKELDQIDTFINSCMARLPLKKTVQQDAKRKRNRVKPEPAVLKIS